MVDDIGTTVSGMIFAGAQTIRSGAEHSALHMGASHPPQRKFLAMHSSRVNLEQKRHKRLLNPLLGYASIRNSRHMVGAFAS